MDEAERPPDPPTDPTHEPIRMHQRIALRLLQEGHPHRAFSELVRTTRDIPMNGVLAAAIAGIAVRADSAEAGISVLRLGLDDAEGKERVGVRRALARLMRRSDDLEGAREQLVMILAERPGDSRARFALNALLEREERWEELDASLEKQTRDAVQKRALKRASRTALKRARLWGERLGDPARAALRYAQAAQFALDAGDAESAFLLRLLWLRALHLSHAPARALADALQEALSVGEQVGRAAAVRALAKDLGIDAEATAAMGRPLAPAPKPGQASISTEIDVPVVEDPDAPAPPKKVAAAAGPVPQPQTQKRRSTQLELMAVAEAVAPQSARKPELAAVLAAAAAEGPDPRAQQRLEAHYIARGAWRELAGFYRECAQKGRDKREKTGWLEKLAELLESELSDLAGAEKAWTEIVQLTGDKHAVGERVRLAQERSDHSGVRRALDEGVDHAKSPEQRAEALVKRAEEALTRKDTARARADFAGALAASPDHPAAACGNAELAVAEGDFGPARRLVEVFARLPRRAPGRGELYRRLARLADQALKDQKLARVAWSEVLFEHGEDDEALSRLPELARALGDDVALEKALRALIRRTPRGPQTRLARMELVELLDRARMAREAMDELRQAVRYEPGHREAWLALADRLMAVGKFKDVGWALEHAATATPDATQRLLLWARLGRHWRDVMQDEKQAAIFEARVERMKQELKGQMPEGLVGGPLEVPPLPRRSPEPPPPASSNVFEGESKSMTLTARPKRKQRKKPGEGDWSAKSVEGKEKTFFDEALSGSDDVVELHSEDIELPSAELLVNEVKVPVPDPAAFALGDPDLEVPPSFSGPAMPSRIANERHALFERVRSAPLDLRGYQMLADHFDISGDPLRASMMREIADALDGEVGEPPRAPRLILTAGDRAGLRHPTLRGDSGEFLGLAGVALCRLYPARGPGKGTNVEFTIEAGKGAKAAADALLAAVRILGLRAPDVYLSADNGPPFALVWANAPRVLVGKLAVKRDVPEAELRFFAGRALFTQNPDLLALRDLRREQIEKGLGVLREVVMRRPTSLEAKMVRDSMPTRGFDRFKELLTTAASNLDLAKLAEGARHSANRAGLVVCGGVGPALAALRAKKALESELIEMVRFASSERYLAIRSRTLR